MTRDEFAKAFNRCWLCGSAGTEWNPLETHEIARGNFRAKAVKEPAAWVRTCHACHRDRLDSMPIARQLGLKLVHDPSRYSRLAVNELRHRSPGAVSETDVAIEVAKLFAMR